MPNFYPTVGKQDQFQLLAKMNGEDDQMNKRMSPVGFKKYWSSKVNLSFGLNYINSNEFLKNNRLAFELVLPSPG